MTDAPQIPPVSLQPIDGFNPEQVILELGQRFEVKLKKESLSPEDQAYLLGFINQFAQIAAQQILEQRMIEVPPEASREGFSSLPYTGVSAGQTMFLFCEGVYYAVLKGWKMGLPQDFHTQLAGSVAQHVFDTTKQLVLSTQGQELTPEYQITEEQQIAYVNQTAESALLYYVNEYEKTNGPFNPEERVVEEELEAPEIVTDEPRVEAKPLPPQPVQSNVPAGSREQHTKYAALALLLTTLKPSQQQKIFQQFTPEEQQVMNYYALPQNVERVLDIHQVTEHLMKLKKQIKADHTSIASRSMANRAIEEMTQVYPKENLIAYVNHERPKIKKYLESSFATTDKMDPMSLFTATDETQNEAKDDQSLSSKVESVLHRFLSQQVS